MSEYIVQRPDEPGVCPAAFKAEYFARSSSIMFNPELPCIPRDQVTCQKMGSLVTELLCEGPQEHRLRTGLFRRQELIRICPRDAFVAGFLPHHPNHKPLESLVQYLSGSED